MIEKQVLAEDLELANRLVTWGNYCNAQMDHCIKKFNLEGVRHWSLEHQRCINDLKALQFKKMDKERIVIDARS